MLIRTSLLNLSGEQGVGWPSPLLGYIRIAPPRFLRVGRLCLLVCLMCLLTMGCSGGGGDGIEPPAISPQSAAAQALAEYDTNKDGFLDAKELERCPALKSALKRIDTNKDGRLSADEIAHSLTDFQQHGMLTTATVEVTLDGNPLSGTTVTLRPEKFMGPAFKPASAVTDAAGLALLKVEGQVEGVVPLGYYRIEVSKKNAQGQEIIPSRYNANTILGHETMPSGEGRGAEDTITLRLTSR